MSIQDAAAVTVIFTFGGSILLWIGSKLFATRKDFHDLNNKITSISLTQTMIETDLRWLKEFHENNNPN